jgi:hypothetical protein
MHKTTLIVGAGVNKEIWAECDLGSELIKNIADRVTDRTSPNNHYFSTRLDKIGLDPDVREKFVRALDNYKNEVKVPSIDAFLDEVESFPEYQNLRDNFKKIGRLAIVFHVMGYEGTTTKSNINNDIVVEKTWMSRVCNLLKEKVINEPREIDLNIITFNYDRILEYYLLNWFRHSKPIIKFIDDKVKHFYGRIGCLEGLKVEADEKTISFDLGNDKIEVIEQIKDSIQLIHQERADKGPMKEIIAQSDEIWIMGYGFDATNNRLLGLNSLLEQQKANMKVAVYPGLNFAFRREMTEIIRDINFEADIRYLGCSEFIGYCLGGLIDNKGKLMCLKGTPS